MNLCLGLGSSPKIPYIKADTIKSEKKPKLAAVLDTSISYT